MTGDPFGSCGHRARPELSIQGGQAEAGVLGMEVVMASFSIFSYSSLFSRLFSLLPSKYCCHLRLYPWLFALGSLGSLGFK